jgi:hypothetical protein
MSLGFHGDCIWCLLFCQKGHQISKTPKSKCKTRVETRWGFSFVLQERDFLCAKRLFVFGRQLFCSLTLLLDALNLCPPDISGLFLSLSLSLSLSLNTANPIKRNPWHWTSNVLLQEDKKEKLDLLSVRSVCWQRTKLRKKKSSYPPTLLTIILISNHNKYFD